MHLVWASNEYSNLLTSNKPIQTCLGCSKAGVSILDAEVIDKDVPIHGPRHELDATSRSYGNERIADRPERALPAHQMKVIRRAEREFRYDSPPEKSNELRVGNLVEGGDFKRNGESIAVHR